MNERALFELTQHWTPDQLLALYDFCRLMEEVLWQRHEDTLLEQMIIRDQENGFEPFSSHRQENLELPFDDPIPF